MIERIIRRDGDVVVVQLDFTNSVARTKQSFKDECDINNIMGAWSRTGETHHVNERAPQWGDFSEITDYQTAANTVIEAKKAFASMPAATRARFQNDPNEVLSFLSDPENRAEAIELDLLDPDPAPSEDPAPEGAAASEPTAPPPEPTPIAGGE